MKFFKVLLVGSAESRRSFISSINRYFKVEGVQGCIADEGELPVQFPFSNKYVKGAFKISASAFRAAGSLSSQRFDAVFMLCVKEQQACYMSLIHLLDSNLKALLLSPSFSKRCSKAIEEVAFGQDFVQTIEQDFEQLASSQESIAFKSGILVDKEGIQRVLELLIENMGIEEQEKALQLGLEDCITVTSLKAARSDVKEQLKIAAVNDYPASKKDQVETNIPPQSTPETPELEQPESKMEQPELDDEQPPQVQQQEQEDPQQMERQLELMNEIAEEMRLLRNQPRNQEGDRSAHIQRAEQAMMRMMNLLGENM